MVSLKTQATASNKGFTLVELIVVITILAILGTIGFISLQGYSAQSRDSKRASDLRSISTAINVTNTNGIGLLQTVTPVTGNQLTAPSVGGSGSTLATDYTAGTPNYTVLGQNGNNFKDPATNGDYPVGVTTRGGGGFQVAARLEGGGVQTASVQGSFAPRTITLAAVAAAAVSGSSFTLATADLGKLKIGDRLSGITAAPANVVDISADGLKVTMSAATNAGTPVFAADSLGLIKQSVGTAPVVDKSTTTIPY
jgi:prepilin-type N-terminal cleavage/methylation domain-containing protein